MYIKDLDFGFAFEVFAQFGDIDVHIAGVVEAVVAPDFLEGVAAFEDVILLVHEHFEQLCLAGGDAFLLALDGEGLPFLVEGDAAELYDVVAGLLGGGAAQEGLDAGLQLLNGEGLGDVVVTTDGEPLDKVFLQVLGGQEDDGDFLVQLADLLGQRETVHQGHHHVHDADVERLGAERLVGDLPVGGVGHVVPFGGEVGGEHLAQIDVVFSE